MGSEGKPKLDLGQTSTDTTQDHRVLLSVECLGMPKDETCSKARVTHYN